MSPPHPAALARRHPSEVPAPSVRFAHPSERVFASLLSLYGITWEYEPVEFPLAWDEAGQVVRAFRPDFYLPEHRSYVELTVLSQHLVTRKNRKIREFRALYPDEDILVVYQRDFRALCERHALSRLGTPDADA